MRFILFLVYFFIALPAFAAAPPANFLAASVPSAPPAYTYLDESSNEQPLHAMVGMGQVLIINFWATWCPPCVKEMPSLNTLASLLPAEKYRVLTISLDDEPAAVNNFFKQKNLTQLTPWRDPALAALRTFGVRGLPATIIIDGNGMLLGYVRGELDWTAPDVVAWLKTIS